MARRRPTKLEIDRLKRRAGVSSGPLRDVAELSKDERELVASEFFAAVWVDAQKHDYYEIYARVLASWGIMCPHPEDRRDYASRYMVCSACQAIIPYREMPTQNKRARG